MSLSTLSPSRTVARPRASLAVAMLGFFVVALDAQIVNVALPEIRNDLGGGLSGLQWIVTGYTLMFSALQLFSGTFSDRAGARRAYGLGMILFTVASLACGFSPSLPVLIAGRILQGIGAAMITPSSLALIREAYQDAASRGRAIVYWGLGGSVAAAAGPVLGGLLTQIDWRLIFFVNLLFLPMTGLVAVLNPLAARLMARFGNVAMIAAGQLLMALGLAGLWVLPADAPALLVALVMVPVGVGGSFTVPPIIALVMDHVPAQNAGTASGVINTARQVGGSLGVAIYGALLAGHDFTAGLRLGLGTTAVVLLILIAATRR